MRASYCYVILILSLFSISIQGQIVTETDSQSDILEYHEVDLKPQFGDDESGMFLYLAKNVNYPEEAKANKIQGTVTVGFVVSNNGEVTNVKLLEST